MTRDELLTVMRAERAHWEALLTSVGDDGMSVPGAEDAWTVCEILSHISRDERWLAVQLAEVLGDAVGDDLDARSPTGLWDASTPRRAVRHRAGGVARAESANVFVRLLELVAKLPEETLGLRFPWTAGRSVWQTIASESYQHYGQHARSIRVWLAGRAA